MRGRIGLAAILIAVLGCGRPLPPAEPASPLYVAAASDLREVLPPLAEAFEAKTGRPVALTFGSSGQLAQQIENGAPFDVFLSANRDFISKLADADDVMAESIAPYATGALALGVNPRVVPSMPGLTDLARDARIRHVAIANPDLAPYGAAARQALERSGTWADLQPKLVPVDTVDQAAQMVASGAVEVGLVSVSGAAGRGLLHQRIDPALYDPLVQYMGITRVGMDDRDTLEFVAFIGSEESRGAFLVRGFGPPPSTP